jgi:hypothetical protein
MNLTNFKLYYFNYFDVYKHILIISMINNLEMICLIPKGLSVIDKYKQLMSIIIFVI